MRWNRDSMNKMIYSVLKYNIEWNTLKISLGVSIYEYWPGNHPISISYWLKLVTKWYCLLIEKPNIGYDNNCNLHLSYNSKTWYGTKMKTVTEPTVWQVPSELTVVWTQYLKKKDLVSPAAERMMRVSSVGHGVSGAEIMHLGWSTDPVSCQQDLI